MGPAGPGAAELAALDEPGFTEQLCRPPPHAGVQLQPVCTWQKESQPWPSPFEKPMSHVSPRPLWQVLSPQYPDTDDAAAEDAGAEEAAAELAAELEPSTTPASYAQIHMRLADTQLRVQPVMSVQSTLQADVQPDSAGSHCSPTSTTPLPQSEDTDAAAELARRRPLWKMPYWRFLLERRSY